MIDLSLGEMLELAREAELQKRLEEDGFSVPDSAREPFPEFCVIALRREVKDDQGFRIPEGAQGTVLDSVADGAAYIVEFSDPAYQNAERIGLATLPPDVMQVVWLSGDPVTMPEDLRGKLGEANEGERGGTAPDPSQRRP